MPRGGRRSNSGPAKGTKYKPTLNKEVAREEARAFIQAHMPRMLSAQVENACGLAHLMIRNQDGTWRQAPDEMTGAEVAAVLNGDPNRYYIAMKDPNTQVFNTLAAYAWDKPKEQEQDINLKGSFDVVEILRQRQARRRKA